MDSHPNHIAIILDGNRRWAKKRGALSWKGHEAGASKVESLMKWARELKVRELTLYCFSTENFNRPKKEVDFLMDIFRKEFEKLRTSSEISKEKVRIRAIGRLFLFPKDIQEALLSIEEKTKDHDRFQVNFALGYGGRQEITDGVREIARKVKAGKIDVNSITETTITNHLSLSHEPDIVIRPGGEIRTSNFLIWQSNYSEWFFLKKLWPEFTKNDLKKVISEFKERQRRFGA